LLKNLKCDWKFSLANIIGTFKMSKRPRESEDDIFVGKLQKCVISLPVEIIVRISEFVEPEEFIIFSTLSREVRKYILGNNIQYKGMFRLNDEFEKFDKVIPFVTKLKTKYTIFIDNVLQILPNLKSMDLSGNLIILIIRK
jgi:hypothetical protein